MGNNQQRPSLKLCPCFGWFFSQKDISYVFLMSFARQRCFSWHFLGCKIHLPYASIWCRTRQLPTKLKPVDHRTSCCSTAVLRVLYTASVSAPLGSGGGINSIHGPRDYHSCFAEAQTVIQPLHPQMIDLAYVKQWIFTVASKGSARGKAALTLTGWKGRERGLRLWWTTLCCWPQNTHISALVALDICQDWLLSEKVLHLGGNKKSPRDREQSFGVSPRSVTPLSTSGV